MPMSMRESDMQRPNNARLSNCLHNQAILIVLDSLFEFVVFVVRWRMRLPRRGGLDDCEALFGPFVAVVGCFDVPDVCFKRVTAAPNAHFREVPAGVFGFGKTWKD